MIYMPTICLYTLSTLGIFIKIKDCHNLRNIYKKKKKIEQFYF